jgi:hypothetical protein
MEHSFARLTAAISVMTMIPVMNATATRRDVSISSRKWIELGRNKERTRLSTPDLRRHRAHEYAYFTEGDVERICIMYSPYRKMRRSSSFFSSATRKERCCGSAHRKASLVTHAGFWAQIETQLRIAKRNPVDPQSKMDEAGLHRICTEDQTELEE